jgi:hypothetical protein
VCRSPGGAAPQIADTAGIGINAVSDRSVARIPRWRTGETKWSGPGRWAQCATRQVHVARGRHRGRSNLPAATSDSAAEVEWRIADGVFNVQGARRSPIPDVPITLSFNASEVNFSWYAPCTSVLELVAWRPVRVSGVVRVGDYGLRRDCRWSSETLGVLSPAPVLTSCVLSQFATEF